MPVSKNKLKIPRLYLKIIRKECKMTQKQFADFLKVETSTVTRYENGSCDFFSDKLSELLNHISDLCGISLSTLIQNESDYQKRINTIRNYAVENIVSMPSIANQKQIANINLIKEYQGLSTLPPASQLVAETRLRHPEISSSELAKKLNMSYKTVSNHFFIIRKIANEIEKKV